MPEPSIRFEEFELDVDGCELRAIRTSRQARTNSDGAPILLLKSPGKLVRRETIEQHIWGGNGVLETEHSINTAINKLRMILRDDSRDPHFIRTVIGHCYRFIANVKHTEPIEESPAPSHSFPPSGVLATTTNGMATVHEFRRQPAATPNGTGIKQAAIPDSAAIPDQLPIQAPPRIGTAARKPRSRRQLVHCWLSRISGRDRNHCWVGSPYSHAQNSVTAV